MEMMPRRALLELLADRAVGLESGLPVLVGVDGVDGAGKSTLSEELRSALEARGRGAIHVELDDFQRPRELRNRRGPHSPEGCYEDVFDLEAISALGREPMPEAEAAALRQRMELRWRRGWLPAQRLYEELADPVRRASVLIDNSEPAMPRVEWRVSPGASG
jgi:hypothetical protein